MLSKTALQEIEMFLYNVFDQLISLSKNSLKATEFATELLI